MEQQFCQSCGMPLSNTNKGTNADGSLNEDYCTYCYQNGKFTQNLTMSQMIEKMEDRLYSKEVVSKNVHSPK